MSQEKRGRNTEGWKPVERDRQDLQRGQNNHLELREETEQTGDLRTR